MCVLELFLGGSGVRGRVVEGVGGEMGAGRAGLDSCSIGCFEVLLEVGCMSLLLPVSARQAPTPSLSSRGRPSWTTPDPRACRSTPTITRKRRRKDTGEVVRWIRITLGAVGAAPTCLRISRAVTMPCAPPSCHTLDAVPVPPAHATRPIPAMRFQNTVRYAK